MINAIDHIGIAVKDLGAAVRTYESLLGLKCDRIEEVPGEKVKAAFFRVGDIHIELLQSTSEDGAIASFIRKKGEGIHHIAFQTTDIIDQLAHARKAGLRLIREHPTDGAGGKQIAFVHPASTHGALIEFCTLKVNPPH